MDPVSNLAQAHAAMVLHHLMNGGMGAPMPFRGPAVPPPHDIWMKDPLQPIHPMHQGPVNLGLLHLLGLGGHDLVNNGGLQQVLGGVPRQPIQPSPGPGFGGAPPTPIGWPGPGGPQLPPVSGPYQPLSIKAWNA